LHACAQGHGFFKEEASVDLYNHLQAFLEKYIGPGVCSNGSPLGDKQKSPLYSGLFFTHTVWI
jgi:hypothetical protein